MISINQILERANEWLRGKGGGPLNSREIVHLITKIVNILDSKKHSSLIDLEKNLVLCAGIHICKLRGYRVPEVIRWRNKVIDTVKER